MLGDSIEQQFELAKQRQAAFGARLEADNTEKVAAVDRIDECERKIAKKTQKLASCANDNPAQHKEAANRHREAVTKKMVDEVNKILEAEAPVNLVTGLEALVGLLRNARKATNIDVELFFKDHAKLYNKLKRMESTGLNYKLVR